MRKIKEELETKYQVKVIHFNNLTFSDVVENLGEVYEDNKHNEELKLLFEDFNDYCNESGLISEDCKYKLIFVPTGSSYDWNLRHKIYFCPEHWHKQNFTYFGLYKEKSIRAIATVENCIVADFDKEPRIHHSTMGEEITEGHRERLKDGFDNWAWADIHTRRKYYLFKEDDFFETDFGKISKGGIQGHRYKDLEEILGEEIEGKSTEEIARLLKEKNWH